MIDIDHDCQIDEKLRAEGKMRAAGEEVFSLRREAKSGIYAHERSDIPELATPERERFQQDMAAWDTSWPHRPVTAKPSCIGSRRPSARTLATSGFRS